jgi:hypothetical protein
MGRILNQAAHAAVKKNGSHFQAVFCRLLPGWGHAISVAHLPDAHLDGGGPFERRIPDGQPEGAEPNRDAAIVGIRGFDSL